MRIALVRLELASRAARAPGYVVLRSLLERSGQFRPNTVVSLILKWQGSAGNRVPTARHPAAGPARTDAELPAEADTEWPLATDITAAADCWLATVPSIRVRRVFPASATNDEFGALDRGVQIWRVDFKRAWSPAERLESPSRKIEQRTLLLVRRDIDEIHRACPGRCEARPR